MSSRELAGSGTPPMRHRCAYRYGYGYGYGYGHTVARCWTLGTIYPALVWDVLTLRLGIFISTSYSNDTIIMQLLHTCH